MLITVKEVGEIHTEGKLKKMDITYERAGAGKNEGRKLVGIGKTEQVMYILSEASPGDQFEIALEQKGQYWNWVGATKVAQKASEPAKAVAAAAGGRSSWETPEERAVKQQFIIRQSCLTNAVAFLAQTGNSKTTVQTLLQLAENFVSWVNEDVSSEDFALPAEVVQEPAPKKVAAKKVIESPDDLTDDIPF